MASIIKAFGIIAILTLLTPLAQASELPVSSYDSRHTDSTNNDILDDFELLWSYKIGGDLVREVELADGKIFVYSIVYYSDDNKIYCLDENTGELIWSHETVEAPVIRSEKVFVSYNEKVYCLNKDNGRIIWSYEIGNPSTPVVADGKVFVSSDEKTYCLNEDSGKLIWSYEIKEPYLPVIANRKVFVSSDGIYCLDENTGELIWHSETPIWSSPSPRVADGKVFFPCSGVLRKENLGICCLDENTGELIWSYEVGYHLPLSITVSDGKIFCVYHDHGSRPYNCDCEIICLDENTGELIWRTGWRTGECVCNIISLIDERIFYGSSYLYAATIGCLDKNSGELIWKYLTECGAGFSPVVVGKIFAWTTDYCSNETKIYCLDADTGELIWSYETGDWFCSSLEVANGTIFIGSSDNTLYCFKHKAFKALEDAQSSINFAKKVGVANITEAEKLLQKANVALNEYRYEEAKNYANQAKESAEKDRNARSILYGIVALLVVLLFFFGYVVGRKRN